MRILVTGGAGFIGSNIADALIELGHEVTIIDDLSTGFKENIHDQSRFIEMDIRAAEIEDVYADGKFDIVYHEAARVDLRASIEEPVEDLRINLEGSLNLIENARKHNVKKFVFASTGGAVYGEQLEFPANESHQVKPISPYGVGKAAVEKYLYMYNYQFGMDTIALRYANIYGPRQNPFGEGGVVAIFTNRMLRDMQAYINGDGMQTRDFTYIGDVVDANIAALKLTGFQTLNISTAIETNILTIYNSLNELTDAKRNPVHREEPVGEQRRSVIDPSSATELMNWKPQVDINDGLRMTVDFFKSRL